MLGAQKILVVARHGEDSLLASVTGGYARLCGSFGAWRSNSTWQAATERRGILWMS